MEAVETEIPIRTTTTTAGPATNPILLLPNKPPLSTTPSKLSHGTADPTIHGLQHNNRHSCARTYSPANNRLNQYTSFAGETHILIANHTTKPISDIPIGDYLLTFDSSNRHIH